MFVCLFFAQIEVSCGGQGKFHGHRGRSNAPAASNPGFSRFYPRYVIDGERRNSMRPHGIIAGTWGKFWPNPPSVVVPLAAQQEQHWVEGMKGGGRFPGYSQPTLTRSTKSDGLGRRFIAVGKECVKSFSQSHDHSRAVVGNVALNPWLCFSLLAVGHLSGNIQGFLPPSPF